jgi:predicted site-specific integrase-resolvase
MKKKRREKMLTAVQVANKLGYTSKTVRGWVKRGKIPHVFEKTRDSKKPVMKMLLSDVKFFLENWQ